MKKRVNWLDVAKIIGIFCIYLGHFQYYSGYAYDFVYLFHVQLFFFLAGCAENFNTRKTLDSIKRKFVTVLIPFYVFGALSIAIDCLARNSYEYLYLKCFKLLLGAGREDGFVAYQLWFLSSLFVSYLMFYIIKALSGNKRVLILIFGITIWLVDIFFYSHLPAFYNLNYAVSYFKFFIIGYLIYPYLDAWFKNGANLLHKLIRFVVALLCVCTTIYYFFGKTIDFLNVKYIDINTFIIFYTIISISFFVSSIIPDKHFAYGKDTLYFCGNEYIVKTLFPIFCGMFGVKVITDVTLQCYFYTIILFILQHELIIPYERLLINKIQSIIEDISIIKQK